MVKTVIKKCDACIKVMPETREALKKYCRENGLKICYGADILLQEILAKYGYDTEEAESEEFIHKDGEFDFGF